MTHFLLEALAYAVAFQLYRVLAARRDDPLPTASRWTVLVAAALGAAVGSKVLGLLQEPNELAASLSSLPAFFAGGKTIVGALLFGWLGVELAKRRAKITRRTGDPFALPLCLGIAVGRLGCWLAGPADRTHGAPTALAWGVDGGDGVARHPVLQLEVAWLAAVAAWLGCARGGELRQGALFRRFLTAYLAFRLAVDSLKPGTPLAGLTAIQWACAAGLVLLLLDWPRPNPQPADA